MSEELPLLPEDISWEEAQAKLEALDLGDGLPLVPPPCRVMKRCCPTEVHPKVVWFLIRDGQPNAGTPPIIVCSRDVVRRICRLC